MSKRNGALILTAAIILMSAVIAPASDGANVNSVTAGGVTMAVFDDGIGLNTAESGSIGLHLWNGNPDQVKVRITDGGDSVIKLTPSSDEVLLAAGESKDITGELTTDRYTRMGDYSVTVVISVMDGTSDPVLGSVSIPVSVTSNYSSGDRYNRFFGVIDNTLEAPFNTAVTAVAVTFVLWILISVLVSALAMAVIKLVFRAFGRESDTLGRETSVGTFLCVMLYAVSNCLYIAGASERMVDIYWRWAVIGFVILGSFIAWDIYRALISSSLKKMEEEHLGLDTSLEPLFLSLGKIIITLICLALVLSTFNLDIGTIVASVGLAGLGLSFGIKPAINELFSGLIVLTTRPFSVGDFVAVGNNDVIQVSDIGILRTRFNTNYTMDTITMPNSSIASSKIRNLTHRTVKYRTTVTARIPFDTNITRVKKIMKDVAANHPNVVTDGSTPKPITVFSRCVDGSAVIVTLSFYVKDYNENFGTCCSIRESILSRFEENGITIPYERTEISIFSGGDADAQ